MNRPTCTYANTATVVQCDKPAVAWANSAFSLGRRVYFCEEHLAKAKTRKVNIGREFHKVAP